MLLSQEDFVDEVTSCFRQDGEDTRYHRIPEEERLDQEEEPVGLVEGFLKFVSGIRTDVDNMAR